MAFFRTAAALVLTIALTSCGGSEPNSSTPAPAAGDTLASACPEVMELLKQGADGMAKADKDKNHTDPTYLGDLDSVVKRLEEIGTRIVTEEDAALIQNLASGFSSILEEQTNGQDVSPNTVSTFSAAVKELSTACVKAL